MGSLSGCPRVLVAEGHTQAGLECRTTRPRGRGAAGCHGNAVSRALIGGAAGFARGWPRTLAACAEWLCRAGASRRGPEQPWCVHGVCALQGAVCFGGLARRSFPPARAGDASSLPRSRTARLPPARPPPPATTVGPEPGSPCLRLCLLQPLQWWQPPSQAWPGPFLSPSVTAWALTSYLCFLTSLLHPASELKA